MQTTHAHTTDTQTQTHTDTNTDTSYICYIRNELTDLFNGQWSSDLFSSQYHEPLGERISKLVCVQFQQVCNTVHHYKSKHKSIDT